MRVSEWGEVQLGADLATALLTPTYLKQVSQIYSKFEKIFIFILFLYQHQNISDHQPTAPALCGVLAHLDRQSRLKGGEEAREVKEIMEVIEVKEVK